MALSAMQARRLDFIRFFGLEYNETWKEWQARLELKDSACAIRQSVTSSSGRKLRLLDPKSRSFTVKVSKIVRGSDKLRASVTLEITDVRGGDTSTQRIDAGQILLRDALNPQWRVYEAPESDDRLDLSQFV
ncbi:hypothetical protein [Hydrocarboniphaga sp.]|uniref:hypothetical protein n=1 Tax=Hydrocarboniphaga sp. TaxID=2033016 RepID=UPI003D09DA01